MMVRPVLSAMEIARLVVAPRETITGMPATEHFKAISEDILPVQATYVRLKSIFSERPWPMALSKALCLPMSSMMETASFFVEEAYAMNPTRGNMSL